MHNQVPRSSLFREVNERIREITTSWDDSQPVGFFCECDDPACTAPIELTLPHYDAIRATPERLVVIRGHRTAGHVVAGENGYLLVESPPVAAA